MFQNLMHDHKMFQFTARCCSGCVSQKSKGLFCSLPKKMPSFVENKHFGVSSTSDNSDRNNETLSKSKAEGSTIWEG